MTTDGAPSARLCLLPVSSLYIVFILKDGGGGARQLNFSLIGKSPGPVISVEMLAQLEVAISLLEQNQTLKMRPQHARTHAHTHAHACTHVHADTHAHARTRTHTPSPMSESCSVL